MLKGFKDFLLRGNVVDLAVAVVLGAAFVALVTAFTSSIITPLVSVVGGSNPAGLSFRIISSNQATTVNIGGLIGAIINFVMIAAVVYFAIVLPMNVLKTRRKAGVEAGPAEPTDVELLIEIRDLLADRNKTL